MRPIIWVSYARRACLSGFTGESGWRTLRKKSRYSVELCIWVKDGTISAQPGRLNDDDQV